MSQSEAIRIAYNTPGHPREFTINLPGYGHENYIPMSLARKVNAHMGEEYSVESRGSRLEVTSRLYTGDGDEHAQQVIDALLSACEGFVAEDVVLELHPYTPAQPVKRTCLCGCGEELSLKEMLQHKKDKQKQ